MACTVIVVPSLSTPTSRDVCTPGAHRTPVVPREQLRGGRTTVFGSKKGNEGRCCKAERRTRVESGGGRWGLYSPLGPAVAGPAFCIAGAASTAHTIVLRGSRRAEAPRVLRLGWQGVGEGSGTVPEPPPAPHLRTDSCHATREQHGSGAAKGGQLAAADRRRAEGYTTEGQYVTWYRWRPP
eukprot:TRINITY_DN22643_c0_g1_i7.p1 TRINITY_DN22643_c0_g1~~TRINITY_DN22643_c0_g1_i7.p1  ORF type:complete len:182 (-),score=0.97 TRINITY_DN22643_c0_g1_i7:316-861(-)